MKEIHAIIFAICGIVFASFISVTVFGANNITVDNGRREYGYCPIAPETMLSRAEFEINGCPLIRVYVTNWDRLTTLEQTTIDTQMRNAGFKDIAEFDTRVR